MTSNELLPCPFCGGEAEILTAESMNGGYLFGIMCNDCRSRGDVYDTEAEAIAAWNTRAETVTVTGITTVTDTPLTTYVPERTCKNVDDAAECGYFKCSECNIECSIEWCYSGYGAPNYCPNCGRKVER